MTSTLKSAELPLESGTNAKLTEEQARQWLAANPSTGKTVRDIAAIWGWAASTAWRFMKQDVKQDAVKHETVAADETPEGDGRVLGKTPSTAGATLTIAGPPPFIRAPYADDFKWGDPQNEDIIVPEQKAIAIYVNPWGQVVIRARAEDGDEDSFVVIGREHLPTLIERLTAIAKEGA